MTDLAPSPLEIEPRSELSDGRAAAPASGRQESAFALESFEDVFRNHSAMVFRVLRTMGVAESALDEATQDVFLTVHGKLAEFEGRSQLSTWICAITYGVGRNARRKARRNPTFVELSDDAAVSHRTPEQATQERQTAQLVMKFCDALDEGMRDVFVFCLLEQKSAPEVAQLLELSENTVSSRIRLLRKKFRAFLQEVHGKGNAL